MLYDAPLAQRFAAGLLEEGIYAIGFFFRWCPRARRASARSCRRAYARAARPRGGRLHPVGKRLGVLKA
jgi:glycine C-acetyltransferase